MDEFAFIAALLAPLAAKEKGALGLKDDAALLKIPQGSVLAVTKDAVVEGVHFLGDEAPGLIARKALRVNLSDLAAMGATPRWYFLALMLPEKTDDAWLAAFAEGLRADQEEYGIVLAGGDTTRAGHALAVSATALGLVPEGEGLTRVGAKRGDAIYVTGTIGDAALGLKAAKAHAREEYLINRYRLPRPRVKMGEALRGLAHSCIDISDGLAQDLGHICAASGTGAEIAWPQVPLSPPARSMLAGDAVAYETVLAGGDDYELLFTAPASVEVEIMARAKACGVAVTRIGRVTEKGKVRVIGASGEELPMRRAGFRHF